MITLLMTRKHRKVPRAFVRDWAGALAPRLRLIAYEDLRPSDLAEDGAYVFTDLERLFGHEMALARRIEAQLDRHPLRPAILNRPSRYAGRFGLLERLHAAGINEFRAFRADAVPADLRFPVFLKRDYEHSAKHMALYGSRAELDAARKRAGLQDRLLPERLMVVERCDLGVPEGGRYRKYSMMKVGGRQVPRHLLFSQDWVTKAPDLVDAAGVAEEQAFLAAAQAPEHPHRAAIEQAFALAGLDYGRIDYGVKDGRVQVWEINTNPNLMPDPQDVHPLRTAGQSASAAQLVEALAALDREGRAEPPALPAGERWAWRRSQWRSHLLFMRR
jgi:hypothetical protein